MEAKTEDKLRRRVAEFKASGLTRQRTGQERLRVERIGKVVMPGVRAKDPAIEKVSTS